MPGQDTLLTAFQATLTRSDKICGANCVCFAANLRAATSETCWSGEFQQKPMSTETGLSMALGAESEMDIIFLDTGAVVVEGAAAETALEHKLEQQHVFQTPVLPIETTTTKKPVPREKKADH